MKRYLFCLPISLFSLPLSPQLQTGEADFHSAENRLEIRAGDLVHIDWDSFSIEAHETVHFLQPDAQALAVNRVLSAHPSELMGCLNANGRIVLINTNGVVVGKEALIDTGSFIASTLDCKNFELFEGDSREAIVNLGTIKAENGDVLLIANRVENGGSIQASGLCGLIANPEVLFKPAGFEGLYVRGNSFSDAFVCEATNRGSIRAGNVAIFGEINHLTEGSKIDVSSDFGGGTVLIGGDKQGLNTQYQNGRYLVFDRGAQILANGLKDSDGGKVILWSDGVAGCYGQIEATGVNGGFVEVSGKEFLDYQGLSDLRGSTGNAGILLLDPSDIVIGPATAGTVTNAIAGFAFPAGCNLNCNAVNATVPINSIQSVGNASTVSVATITAQLVLGSLVIDAAGGAGAGGGTITWAAGNDFVAPAFNSGNDLILNASGNVTILSNVQNSGAGRVAINATGIGTTVSINTHANVQAVSFGSLNGLTQICAPNANLSLLGGNGAGRRAQIGYVVPNGTNSNSTINVTCNNLLLESGVGVVSAAQIGHGPSAGTALSNSTIICPISVNAAGNITLRTQPAPAGVSANTWNKIGHGGLLDNVAPLANYRGDVAVNCEGALNMTVNKTGDTTIISAIGHGSTITNTANPTQGNIDVFARGNINLGFRDFNLPPVNVTPFTSGIFLGHTSGGTVTNSNVTVYSCGNILVDTSNVRAPGTINASIGNSLAANATSDLTVIAAGSVTINAGDAANVARTRFACIGSFVNGTYNGSVRVIAGTSVNISFNSDVPLLLAGLNMVNIGYNSSGAASNSNTYVAAGTDIVIRNFAAGAAVTSSCGIVGVNDVNVVAFNDILVTSDAPNAAAFAFIGPTQYNRGSETRVYAGRDIIATNNTITANRALLGRSNQAVGVNSTSVTIRAQDDIQLSSDIFLPADGLTSGDILIEADAQFDIGDFINYNGSQVISIADQGIVGSAVNTQFARINCTNVNCINALPIGNSMPDQLVVPNEIGGFRIAKGNNLPALPLAPLVLRTSSGDITVRSASTQRSSGPPLNLLLQPQNLAIGTATNELNLSTISGNIEIWGSTDPTAVPPTTETNCIPTVVDSFNDITIDQVITTSGTVLISANHDISMTAASSIDTTTGDGAVTLIVDNQAPVFPFIGTSTVGAGAGRFSMAMGSTITTGAGPLSIYTALQNLNSINGTLNGALFAPGALFGNSPTEIWCTYFCTPIFTGPNFRVAYKNCLVDAIQEASVIVAQFFVDLHPYNEFPGWAESFTASVMAQNGEMEFSRPYWLRRRHLNIINQPKTWTIIAY
jgi:filamentous hemagglutinin family protein